MSGYRKNSQRKFARSADRAVIAGVCAGIADYFGFRLRVTRLLAIIALCMAAPITLLFYFGAVFLFPSAHDPQRQPGRNSDFDEGVRSPPRQTMGDVRRRFQKLDSRLERMERYVTSPRFDLDQEFRKL
jgi:phage shock protein C